MNYECKDENDTNTFQDLVIGHMERIAEKDKIIEGLEHEIKILRYTAKCLKANIDQYLGDIKMMTEALYYYASEEHLNDNYPLDMANEALDKVLR